MSGTLSYKTSCETHLVGSAPLKYALTDSVKATAMGKASWDARVTGLGPRDVPEKDRHGRNTEMGGLLTQLQIRLL